MRRLDWIIDRLGDYDIDDITLAVISEKVIEDLERRPTRRGTRRGQGDINRFLAALSGVLTFALKRGLTTHKLVLPFNNDYLRAERFPVSFAEEDRIVQWAEAQGKPAHALCLRWLAWTGMRPIELQRLTPEQIKDDHWVLRPSQTKKERQRTCYVEPDLARQMRALIASGTLPNRQQLAATFATAAKKACAEFPVTLYSLRHTFATRMLAAAVRQEIPHYMMGHKLPGVHADYLKVPLDVQREATKTIFVTGAGPRTLFSDHAVVPLLEMQ
jgi:integrase